MSNKFSVVVEGVPSILKGYTTYTNALNQLVDQRRALVADDWDRLEMLANQGLGTAYGSYREMRRNLGVLHAISSEAKGEFAETLRKHSKDDKTRKEFFSIVKEELLKKNPEINNEYLKGLDELAEGKLKGNALLSILKTVPSESQTEMVESAIDATVALAVRSLMSLTYVNFQHHYTINSGHEFVGPYLENEFLNILQTEVDFFSDELENSMKKLHGDLVLGLSPELAAEELAGKLEESLPKFGRVQATIRLYATFLKDAGKGTASEKAGNLSATAGDLTRSAFAAHAAAYYLSLQSKVVHQNPKVKKIINHAGQLAFYTDFPDGKNTEISKVDQLADGDYVEVAGFVQSIETGKDSDGKLITQVTLNDPSSNSNVVAAGIFVHLIHVGLSVGTYCRLNGTWQSKSGINKGNPAIEIEKLSINNLASRSWKISFQDLSDKFVDRWPGGLNISYGLSPHVSGEKEGDSQTLGAGELIYKPFIR